MKADRYEEFSEWLAELDRLRPLLLTPCTEKEHAVIEKSVQAFRDGVRDFGLEFTQHPEYHEKIELLKTASASLAQLYKETVFLDSTQVGVIEEIRRNIIDLQKLSLQRETAHERLWSLRNEILWCLRRPKAARSLATIQMDVGRIAGTYGKLPEEERNAIAPIHPLLQQTLAQLRKTTLNEHEEDEINLLLTQAADFLAQKLGIRPTATEQ